jgi:histidyl-tRNA synthetase
MAFRGNLKKRMQKADAANASYVIICGDDEIATGEITIRSLKSGEQIKRKLSDVERDPRVGRNYFLATVLAGIDGIKASE